jgi:hypothetical protein
MIIRRVGEFEYGYHQFGDVLLNLSDANGDGFDDFYAGTGDSQDSIGFVYYGGPDVDTLPDVTIADFTHVARPAGDLNSDGYSDLAMGRPAPWSGSGYVHVYYGGSPMDSIPDLVITNAEFPGWQTEFGTDCPGVGDFNGDGVDDFAVSAMDIDYYWTVYILSGPGPSSSVDIEHEPTLPGRFQLSQNYPNPFNASTSIQFSLPSRQPIVLSVHNILGQQVAVLLERTMSPGTHKITWDGKDASGREMPSGVYLYRLSAGSFAETRKMLMLK